jgi:hypothetical protein
MISLYRRLWATCKYTSRQTKCSSTIGHSPAHMMKNRFQLDTGRPRGRTDIEVKACEVFPLISYLHESTVKELRKMGAGDKFLIQLSYSGAPLS